MIKHKIGYQSNWAILYFTLLFFTTNLSGQYDGISNVRNWYFKGVFQDVTHHVEGEYTYSFYSVDADTFFYEDQLKVDIPYKRHDVLLLKIDRNGKVVKHAKFNTRKIEDDPKSTTNTQYPKEIVSIDGALYFSIRTGGHLYFNDKKIEGNYAKTEYGSNDVILGLDENFQINFVKTCTSGNVEHLGIQNEELYITGTFGRDSVNIDGAKVIKSGHPLTQKGFLFVYNITQDTLVAKSCFAWGANSIWLEKIRFDLEGNVNFCLSHDSHQIFLGDTVINGNFLGSNPLVLKINKYGELLSLYNGYVKSRNSSFKEIAFLEDGGMIIFGSTSNYIKDSLAMIGQNGREPIMAKTNVLLFVFKVDKDGNTEWYKLIENEKGESQVFESFVNDSIKNIYFLIHNGNPTAFTDENGNLYQKGANLCKMDSKGEMVYIHYFYDILNYFHSMDLREENILSINTFLKFRKNDMEKIFGRQLRHQGDGVIFDFDMSSMFTGIEDEGSEKGNKWIVYPNPVLIGVPIRIQHDKLTEGQYELYTLEGQNVESGTFDESYINLKSVLSGVYILKMQNHHIQVNKKIIIYSY